MSNPSITPSDELKSEYLFCVCKLVLMNIFKNKTIFTELEDNVRWFSSFIGIDIFDPHPKPNKRALVSGVVSLLWQALVWYTIVKDLPSLSILILAFVHISFFSQVR